MIKASLLNYQLSQLSHLLYIVFIGWSSFNLYNRGTGVKYGCWFHLAIGA